MKRFWQWLEKNSAQLQGLAAVAAIVGAVAATPYLLSRWLRAELTITVRPERATIPAALEAWVRDASFQLKTLPRTREGEDDPYRSLRELQTKGPLAPARADNWAIGKTDRIRVDLVNETERVIPGVRLRLDRAYPAWGVSLVATFLTPEEIENWRKGFAYESGGPSVVLPELPPLPPKSAASIVAHGNVADADVSATVPGAAFKIVREVHVEDKWPVSAVLRPYWLFLAAPLMLLALLAGLAKFENLVWRRARRHIAYDLACSEARAGRTDSAIALLEKAIAAGYSNFQHARTDPDLETLRGSESFKRLVGS